MSVSRLFFLFAAFYFTKYFTFKQAPFHELMYQNFQDLATGSAKEAAWIAYRDGAKAFIVKLGLVCLIAREQVISALRHNGKHVSAWGDRLCIKVDPYDKANTESIFFDVVTELQANELLIADFAHLYYQPRRNVRAATDADAWSRIPQQYPPDFVLHDDLENAITSESAASELLHTDTNWRNGRRQAMSFAGDRKRLATGASTTYLQ